LALTEARFVHRRDAPSVMLMTFDYSPTPLYYSSSGRSTGSPRGRQTPQCRASSTTSARSDWCLLPRNTSMRNGCVFACSRHVPRPQKRHAP